MPEQLDLSERSQAEHRVVEGRYPLDRNLGPRRHMNRRHTAEVRQASQSCYEEAAKLPC